MKFPQYVSTSQRTVSVVGMVDKSNTEEKEKGVFIDQKGYIDEDQNIWIFSGEGKPKNANAYPYFWFKKKKKKEFSEPSELIRKAFSTENMKDMSVVSIVENTEANVPLFDEQEIVDINSASAVYIPIINENDDFLKKIGFVKWRDAKAIKEVTDEYIKLLEIRCTSSKQKAKELSGGNQQKICLAKAFAIKPRLLFVSEPTRGIDIGAKALVLNALRKYNEEQGTTIVMISSELEELRSICDRVAIVSDGKIQGILPSTEKSEDFGLLMVGQSSKKERDNG